MFGSKSENTDPKVQEYLAEIASLNEEITSYKQTIAAFYGTKESYKAQNEADKNRYEAQIAVLKQQLIDKDKEVNIRVNKTLGSVGVDTFVPEQITISTPSTLPLDALGKFQQLSGNERSEYYKNNKLAIDQGLEVLINQTKMV